MHIFLALRIVVHSVQCTLCGLQNSSAKKVMQKKTTKSSQNTKPRVHSNCIDSH